MPSWNVFVDQQLAHAGGDDRNGATSAPHQQASAAQADVSSPATSSVAPHTARQQAAGQEAQQQFRSSGMPLGAVDISRAGASAPALPDDNTDAAAPNVVGSVHARYEMQTGNHNPRHMVGYRPVTAREGSVINQCRTEHHDAEQYCAPKYACNSCTQCLRAAQDNWQSLN